MQQMLIILAVTPHASIFNDLLQVSGNHTVYLPPVLPSAIIDTAYNSTSANFHGAVQETARPTITTQIQPPMSLITTTTSAVGFYDINSESWVHHGLKASRMQASASTEASTGTRVLSYVTSSPRSSPSTSQEAPPRSGNQSQRDNSGGLSPPTSQGAPSSSGGQSQRDNSGEENDFRDPTEQWVRENDSQDQSQREENIRKVIANVNNLFN